MVLWITYKNMAALDKGVELEEVAKKVFCNTECQNKARVVRNGYRKVLGNEIIRSSPTMQAPEQMIATSWLLMRDLRQSFASPFLPCTIVP